MAGFAEVVVEIAFDAGFRTPLADATFTDVSDWVDSDVQIEWGRPDELSQTSPSTCTVTLDNTDGRFTAGNASSPYYPNVKLDRILRVTVTPDGGSPSVRFVGYIDSWPSTWPGGSDSYAAAELTAVSRLGRLGLRNALRSIQVESAVANGATDVFPLDESTGSVSAGSETSSAVLRTSGSGKALRFNNASVTFMNGKHLSGSQPFDVTGDLSVALTFRTSSAVTGRLYGPVVAAWWASSTWAPFDDGQRHRLVFTYDQSADEPRLYIDGVLVEQLSALPTSSVPDVVGKSFTGSLNDLCRFDGVLLSPTDVTEDYTAFLGGYGSTTDEVLELFAGFGNIPPVEVDADAGATTMGGVDTGGLALVDALRVVESTEGGTLIDARNGDLRLIGRRARYGASSVVTLDMSLQQIGSDFAPTLSRSSLRNVVVATNAATNLLGVEIAAVTREARDDDSVDEYGEFGSSIEINAENPDEAFTAASWMVANHSQPSSRVPSLSFCPLLFDAADQDDLLAVFSGDMVTATNLASQAPDAELDFFVEGGSETWGAVNAWITWSVSPVGLEGSIFQINVDSINDATKFIGY